MAEYGSSGIWGFSDNTDKAFRHAMYEHGDLNLPSELSKSLKDWIEMYEKRNLNNTLDTDSFNKKGMMLAKQVKLHVGNQRHVEYQGETEDGGLLEPVLIN